MPELASLVQRSADFHRERAIEYFLALTGQKDRLEAAGIARAYPELFSPRTLDYISGLSDSAAPARLRAALLRQFSDYRLGDALREAQERLTNAEGVAQVECDGAIHSYRAVPALLSSDHDAERRARLCGRWLSVLGGLNPQRVELKQLEARALGELGYADAADHARRLHGLRLEPLHARLQGFLERCAPLYRERLAHYAAQSGIEPSGGRPLAYSDLNYVMAGRQYDGLFDPKGMLPALRRTLAGLGIALERPGITLDLETRPRKTPRAFCTSPDAPRDVRLVLTPRGGQEDYATLFHEAGHMLFSSHMDGALPFVYRHHGDTSVHESYAFLFQHLTESPAWWYEVLGVKRLDSAPEGSPPGTPSLRAALAFMRFDRLYMLRRYSAKLGYELGFFAGGGIDGGGQAQDARAEEYAQALTDATGFDYPAVRYLDDFDARFYVAQYLQAWIWEAQLRRHIEREFGETWFMKKAAGDFLRELWAPGMQYDIWETAARLGYGDADSGGGLNADWIEAELLA